LRERGGRGFTHHMCLRVRLCNCSHITHCTAAKTKTYNVADGGHMLKGALFQPLPHISYHTFMPTRRGGGAAL
jgi:hypothetical protein